MTRGRFPIKGKAGMGLNLIFKYSNPKGSGVLLTILGVDDGKQEIMSRLGITDGDGIMHYPRDDDFVGKRGYDADYFKQLIAEHRVMRQVNGIVYPAWEPIVPKSRNEALDLAVYNLACAKSCVGRNEEAFWKSRYELLKDEKSRTLREKKNGRKKFVTVSREMDLWA